MCARSSPICVTGARRLPPSCRLATKLWTGGLACTCRGPRTRWLPLLDTPCVCGVCSYREGCSQEMALAEAEFARYPLQYCPFTPELQRQSRGQRRISQGFASDGRGGLSAVRVKVRTRYPFNTGSVPLNHTGNPGVNDDSHRGAQVQTLTPGEVVLEAQGALPHGLRYTPLD